jgi:hypothetical protein
MRTLIVAIMSLAFIGAADARHPARVDGRGARPGVETWLQKRDLSMNVRVHALKLSRSHKSVQVAVENTNSGSVRLLNIRRSSGKAYNTPTGLTKQSTARGAANLKLRREVNNKNGAGTFSGVDSSGLTGNGNQYVMKSHTDPNEQVRVNLRNGKAYRSDR